MNKTCKVFDSHGTYFLREEGIFFSFIFISWRLITL